MTSVRRCSHCRQTGHNIRTCPTRIAAQNIPSHSPIIQHVDMQMKTIEVINENPYSICVFWSRNLTDSVRTISLKYLTNINGHEMYPIRCNNKHRIVIIPFEQIIQNNLDNSDTININQYENLNILVDINISDIDITSPIIFIDKIEYTIQKNEIDQWKECGLKSMFLLNEIERLGGRKYENLEPIIDMVQDIKIPSHTEADKELAGVPNVFTNLT
jgi:hypothetical protein